MPIRTLSDFAKSKSNYVSIGEGESYTAIYKGFKFIEKEVRGEVKEYARFMLEDLRDNTTRFLDSQSASLAKQMDKVIEGSVVKISRKGEGFDTKWKVETGKITDKKEVKDKDIPVIEDFPDDEEIDMGTEEM